MLCASSLDRTAHARDDVGPPGGRLGCLVADSAIARDGAVDIGAFAGLSIMAVQALAAIDEVSRPSREVQDVQRTASLWPRRLKNYLSLPWRLAPFAVAAFGLALLAWRVSMRGPNRPWVPIGFILVAPIFLWLCEVWMRNEVSGGSADCLSDAEDRRGRRVREIFAMELTLLVGLVGLGHALLYLDWSTHGPFGVAGSLAGAVLGVVGCALALSSELSHRRYRPSTVDPQT